MLVNKPHAESCDQNRSPIFAVIQPLLQTSKHLLEIGSGTGQHAVYFAPELPHLSWQTSDCQPQLAGIQLWLEGTSADNILPPIELDVLADWPAEKFDAVYSANTLHIMSITAVEAFFKGVGRILQPGGCLLVYGPFNYNGQYTSDSNAQFDIWLKQRDPLSAIRHFEEVNQMASEAGMQLREDFAMPANNRILYWQKS